MKKYFAILFCLILNNLIAQNNDAFPDFTKMGISSADSLEHINWLLNTHYTPTKEENYWVKSHAESPINYNVADYDSIVAQLIDVKWYEKGFYREWSKPIDSSDMEFVKRYQEEMKDLRPLKMLFFTNAEKSEDSFWNFSCYPFHLNKTTDSKSFSAHGPFLGKMRIKGEKIVNNYYQIEQFDEILFFDKDNLVIRHKYENETEVVRYVRIYSK